MKVFQITNIKDFMNKLLLSELFDHFLLSEASIQTKVTYIIDGRLTKDFWTKEELEEEGLCSLPYAPFSLLRSDCCNLIKGKKTPAAFKFIFLLSPDNLANTLAKFRSGFSPEDLNGVFLNIKYADGRLTYTTGVSYQSFTLDKSFEQYWDKLAAKFLTAHGIDFEELT